MAERIRRMDDPPEHGRMKWKPIAALTEQEYDEAHIRNRLMLWNDCNGPHQLSYAHSRYLAAWDIQSEQVWTKYLILPETA